MSFSVGGGLLSVAMVALVFSVFVVAVAQAYHVYAEKRNSFEYFQSALDVAEQIRGRAMAEDPASFTSWLNRRAVALGREGLSIRVEIRDQRGELIFSHGQDPGSLTSYLSPPVGVALPISFRRGVSVEPCDLAVRVWRF